MNYAMVVTDDEDEKVKSLADTQNSLSDQLEEPFQVDALSTTHPALKDYQWTSAWMPSSSPMVSPDICRPECRLRTDKT